MPVWEDKGGANSMNLSIVAACCSSRATLSLKEANLVFPATACSQFGVLTFTGRANIWSENSRWRVEAPPNFTSVCSSRLWKSRKGQTGKEKQQKTALKKHVYLHVSPLPCSTRVALFDK